MFVENSLVTGDSPLFFPIGLIIKTDGSTLDILCSLKVELEHLTMLTRCFVPPNQWDIERLFETLDFC